MFLMLAFLMGFMVIAGPILNGDLSKSIGSQNTSFLNFFTGAITAIFLFIGFNSSVPSLGDMGSIPLPNYSGALIGVVLIFLLNWVAVRIPALYIVVLPFLGQMITSMLIDYFLLDKYSPTKLLGAIVVVVGLIVNSYLNKKTAEEKSKSL